MKVLLVMLVVAYIAYAAVMVVLHPRFIYPFQPDEDVLPGFERVVLTASDGIEITVQERVGSGPVVLYFMGNAGALAFFEAAFPRHIEADRHVIALEYRGGAGRPGKPSEAVLKADALVAADYALELGKPLIVQGYSLGSGLATYVAANRDVEGVLLVAPYDRLCGLMAARSYLPACWLPMVQKWQSFSQLQGTDQPVLVLHGSDDGLIPPAYSTQFATLPNVDRQIIDGAGHTDIGDFPAYDTAIAAFFASME